MATAVFVNPRDLGYESRIGISGGNPVGERYCRADTKDDEAAYAAALVLCPVGTAYSGSFPTCKSMDYSIVKQSGASTWIRIGYGILVSSASIDGSAISSTAFHEPRQSSTQVEIYNDISGNPVPRTTINTSALQLVVTGYRSGSQYLTALTHWATLTSPSKRNNASVAIPAMYDVSGSNFTAAASELLARTMAATPVKTGLVKVEYTFDFGPAGTHAYTYRDVDEDGVPTGSPVTAQVYATATFTPSSLWG